MHKELLQQSDASDEEWLWGEMAYQFCGQRLYMSDGERGEENHAASDVAPPRTQIING